MVHRQSDAFTEALGVVLIPFFCCMPDLTGVCFPVLVIGVRLGTANAIHYDNCAVSFHTILAYSTVRFFLSFGHDTKTYQALELPLSSAFFTLHDSAVLRFDDKGAFQLFA